LPRYINFCCVRANSARMLLRLALSHGHITIGQKDYKYVQITMKTIIDGSRCWIDNTSQKASIIFSCAFWIIYILIGYRHPFIRYWLPLLAKTTATSSVPHPENEH
jgi:hypothetical protein